MLKNKLLRTAGSPCRHRLEVARMGELDTSDVAFSTESLDTAATPTLESSSGRDQPFWFLDLPTELRCQVHECFVVIGKVFYTPDEYSVRNKKRF